jgi:hypothetical protein
MNTYSDIAVITGGEATIAIGIDVDLTEAQEHELVLALGAALCAPKKTPPAGPWAVALDLQNGDWELVREFYPTMEDAALFGDACFSPMPFTIVRIDQ